MMISTAATMQMQMQEKAREHEAKQQSCQSNEGAPKTQRATTTTTDLNTRKKKSAKRHTSRA
jgi:hypothetical protein